MKVAITCKKAVDLISKKEEGKLTPWQRVQLWNHLAVCSLCRNFSRQTSWFRTLYKTDSERKLTSGDKNDIATAAMRPSDPGIE